MAGLKERLTRRWARASRTLPGRVAVKFAEDNGPTWATLIAWNSLSAMLPVTLAVAAVLGFVLSGSGVTERTVSNLILEMLPSGQNAQQQVLQAIDGAEHRSGVFAILALIGFLWIASNLFGAMEAGFDRILRCPRRNLLLQKLRALVLMAALTILAGIAVGSAALLALAQSLPDVPMIEHGVAGVVLQIVIGTGSSVLLFLVLYRLVPNTELSARTLLPGALVGGVAFEVLTLLLPLYLLFISRNLYLYGKTFSLLFFLLFFFFAVGTITVVGMEVNSVVLERSPGEKARGSGLIGSNPSPTPPQPPEAELSHRRARPD